MTHVTCRLTANNRNQIRNPTFGNRVWATFTIFTPPDCPRISPLRNRIQGLENRFSQKVAFFRRDALRVINAASTVHGAANSQGLYVTVRCPSVCPVDRQQRRRAGLLLSAGADSRYLQAPELRLRVASCREPRFEVQHRLVIYRNAFT